MRGKRTYGGRPGQRMEEQGTCASRTQKHSEAGYGRPVDRGAWTAKTVKRPRQQPAHPQYANYWAPLTRKRHTMPHSAQPQHTNYWAPRTLKRHQQEHRPQRPTESSNPTQHAKGRTGAGRVLNPGDALEWKNCKEGFPQSPPPPLPTPSSAPMDVNRPTVCNGPPATMGGTVIAMGVPKPPLLKFSSPKFPPPPPLVFGMQKRMG